MRAVAWGRILLYKGPERVRSISHRLLLYHHHHVDRRIKENEPKGNLYFFHFHAGGANQLLDAAGWVSRSSFTRVTNDPNPYQPRSLEGTQRLEASTQ